MNKILIIALILGLSMSTLIDPSCQNGGGALPVLGPLISILSHRRQPSPAPGRQNPTSPKPIVPLQPSPAPGCQNPTSPKPIVPPVIVPTPPIVPPVIVPTPPIVPPVVIPTPPVVPILPPTQQPAPSCQQSQPSVYTLSFQYACRSNVAFLSCLGQVVFNDNIIASLTPTDYSIKQYSIDLTVLAGANVLQFIGAGISDSFGLGIDSVKLVAKGTTKNIVINGDFSLPNQNGGWSIKDNIIGWTGLGIEVGQGSIYNSAWCNNQIIELDGNGNYAISQTFTFDSNFNLIANVDSCNHYAGQILTYTLEFDWALRTAGFSNLNSSMANVLFNDVVVGDLRSTGCNTKINHASFSVKLYPGVNTIKIDGTSLSDGYGVSINKVVLSSKYNATNLIVNGLFSQTPLIGMTFKLIDGGVPGWKALKAEVGDCRLYNSNWCLAKCLELDSDFNQRYTQVLNISSSNYAALVAQANAGGRC